MPYQAFKRDDEYCVHKVNRNDEAVGDPLGCHDSMEEAKAQLAALRIAETDEKSTALYKSQPSGDFTVVKAANGQYRWIASFSNNVRDDDNPPEILSAEAHRKYAYMVDKQIVPMPELWVFHIKSWKVGEADWLALDTKDGVTFIVASGFFYDYAVPFAKSLVGKDVALSHGMYPWSVERDSVDPTILTGYISKEVTLLPRRHAANKLTSYSAHYSSEDNKMISQEKRQKLEQFWPGSSEFIEAIEEANGVAASKATELGLDYKATGTEDEMPDETTKAEVEEKEQEEATDTVAPSTDLEKAEEQEEASGVDEPTPEKEEAEETQVAYAPVDDVTAAFKAIADRLTAIDEEIHAVKSRVVGIETKQQEVVEQEKARKEAPLASTWADLISNSSPIGTKQAKITKEEHDAPEEAEEPVKGSGLFFEQFINSKE